MGKPGKERQKKYLEKLKLKNNKSYLEKERERKRKQRADIKINKKNYEEHLEKDRMRKRKKKEERVNFNFMKNRSKPSPSTVARSLAKARRSLPKSKDFS